MTGEQLRPLEGRPYLQQWQERMAEPVFQSLIGTC